MSDFQAVVKYYQHKGYALTNIENGVGEWLAVFEHGSAVEGTELVVVRDEEQLKTETKKYHEQGLSLVDVEVAEG